MATTAQRFYLGTVDDDQDYAGVTENVKKLLEAAPAANTATTVTWTTTTITEKTVLPLAANSAAGDTSNNNGWAYNNGGADGLESTATRQRWFRAGVWNFSMEITLNTAALLDTHALTITARVYRVATGGGARTLLFSATSANQTGSATVTWASASQPEYILEAGEVIMVGFTATSASTTATVLGANTNTVMTVALGANSWVEVPSPGVRSLGIGAFSSAGAATAQAVGMAIFSGVFAAAGAATAAAVGGSRAGGVFSAAGAATAAAVGATRAAGVFSAAGVAASLWRYTSVFSGAFTAAGAAASTWRAGSIFSGVFNGAGVAVGTVVATARFAGVFSAAGLGGGTFAASSISGAVFNGAGVAAGTFRGGLIAGGVFTGVVGGAGGGDIITYQRPVFVVVDD